MSDHITVTINGHEDFDGEVDSYTVTKGRGVFTLKVELPRVAGEARGMNGNGNPVLSALAETFRNNAQSGVAKAAENIEPTPRKTRPRAKAAE